MDTRFTSRLSLIEKALDACMAPGDDVFGTFEGFPLPPDEYYRALTAGAADLLGRGGKRWRPLLAVLVAESLGGEAAQSLAVELSPLVELCHNASLIHDDIEDKSPERRGKPAVHVLYGEDVAINTGAFLYFLAGRCIDRSALSDTEKLRAYQTWSRYMRRLHLGQSMDIGWHRDSDTFPSEELYYTMCRLKTGCLAAFAVEIGAIAANNDAQTANLRKAALEFGVGFQILDDVKNLKGDIKGKNKADDLVEGKKSLPILLYVNSGSENERKERKKLVQSAFNEASHTGNSENEQCSRLLEALTTSGALAQAQEKAEKFIQGAEDVFADFKNLMK